MKRDDVLARLAALAKDLIASESTTARWIGRDALQDLR
jgi:hypothetical protein